MRSEDFHLVLQETMERHDISVKQLVVATGYQKSTLYRLLGGESATAAVVMAVLTAMWELTGDSSLLLTGRRAAIAISCLPTANAKTVDIKMFAEHSKRFAELLQSLADIWADGKADKQDAAHIKTYCKEVDEFLKLLVNSKYTLEQLLDS